MKLPEKLTAPFTDKMQSMAMAIAGVMLIALLALFVAISK